ncbi:hypothetical protein IAU60_003131 [Kwoniella sp. DSM 27419]
MTAEKAYDDMTKEEQAAHDASQRQREKDEQAALPYSWTQDLSTVTVTVPLPKGTRGKDLAVTMGKKKLKVQLKSATEPILEGELFNDIIADDSSWTIDDATLNIELEKLSAHIASHQWWPHVLTHHPKIDTTKIQPENSKLSDLDSETRGMVEKMMYDNQQKAMGKPTSDELKKMEMIEKFKQAHPEMDFSNMTIYFEKAIVEALLIVTIALTFLLFSPELDGWDGGPRDEKKDPRGERPRKDPGRGGGDDDGREEAVDGDRGDPGGANSQRKEGEEVKKKGNTEDPAALAKRDNDSGNTASDLEPSTDDGTSTNDDTGTDNSSAADTSDTASPTDTDGGIDAPSGLDYVTHLTEDLDLKLKNADLPYGVSWKG